MVGEGDYLQAIEGLFLSPSSFLRSEERLRTKERRREYMDFETETVYFISDGEFVKIGRSENPLLRFYNIQGANPKKLEILHIVECNESIFHILFGKYKHRGEWFKIEGELKEFLFNEKMFYEIIESVLDIMEHGFPYFIKENNDLAKRLINEGES